MLKDNKDSIQCILQSDPSLTPATYTRIMDTIENSGQIPDKRKKSSTTRLMRRHEVADRLGCSTRMVDKIAAEGILVKRRFPGRKRAFGFREKDVDHLISNGLK